MRLQESDEDPNGCDVNVDPGLSTVELRALNDRWGKSRSCLFLAVFFLSSFLF